MSYTSKDSDYVAKKDKIDSKKVDYIFPTLKIGIVIPAYNEELNIGKTLSLIPKNISADLTIVVVDDGSKDKTCEVVSQYDVVLIKHIVNRGNGAAVTTGLAYCKKRKFDVAVIIDADGQHDPKYIQKFIKAIIEDDVDFAIGNRFKFFYGGSISKKLASKVMTAFYFLLLQKIVNDPTNGYRALSKKLLQNLDYDSEYSITQEQLFKILPYYKYKEIPIFVHQREHGASFIKVSDYLFKMLFFFVKYYIYPKFHKPIKKLTSLDLRRTVGDFMKS